MKPNGNNERIKRAHLRYLREARRYSEQTVDIAAKAIDRFETYTKRRDFKLFHIEQANGFKDHLFQQVNPRTKRPLSAATQVQTLAALRTFFLWLADQPGYRARIRRSDSDYFNLPFEDVAVASVRRDSEGPTIEQVRHVLSRMPTSTDIDKRNRALIAFALVTGARADALASLRLKHVDLDNGTVNQDARQVRTKKAKTMLTSFFPVGNDFIDIVSRWVRFLIEERQWGLEDALFPATNIARGASGGFEVVGLRRSCWSGTGPIRVIFRDAFAAAGLSYSNPHSLRKTLARFGMVVTKGDTEALKAWSENLGHNQMLTTLTSYGDVGDARKHEILRTMATRKTDATDVERLVREKILEMAARL